MVVGALLYLQIREAYIAGESQRSISKRLGISRPTVKKYCEGVSGRRIFVLRELSPWKLSASFAAVWRGTRKKASVSRRTQPNGSMTVWCPRRALPAHIPSCAVLVHEMKAQYVSAQADMPLEYDPGDAIQIDWGQATIYLRGERKVVQIFCGRLYYSCGIFIMACLNQNAESFLEAQQGMFDHFGGIPRRLIF